MGFVVGDAFGVPLEFMQRETLRKHPVADMTGYGSHCQPIGTWSDDTSMMVCTIDCLNRGQNLEELMKKFLCWYEDGAYSPHGECFDIGNTTRFALEKFSEGYPETLCGGKDIFDNGNGSLMRILPFSLCQYIKWGKNVDEILEVIHEASAITHAHPRSQMACGIFTLITLQILVQKSIEKAVDEALALAMNYYSNHPKYVNELASFHRLNNIQAFKNLQEHEISSSGYVVDTFEAALWSLLSTKNFRECVIKATNLGDDADTVGAMAGALAGLVYGYEAIPEDWRSYIIKREWLESLFNTFFETYFQEGQVWKPNCF